MRFFSYDPDGNRFELHETAEEARSAAAESIRLSVAYSESRGCHMPTDDICWGEVRERCDVDDGCQLRAPEDEERVPGEYREVVFGTGIVEAKR